MDSRTLYLVAFALFVVAAIAFGVAGDWPVAGVMALIGAICLVAGLRRSGGGAR